MAKPDNPQTSKPKSDMTPREAAEQDREQTRQGTGRDTERSEPVRRIGGTPSGEGGPPRQ